MSSKKSIQVAWSKDTVYCKVDGMGSMKNSTALREFTEKMYHQGYDNFVVNLAQCTGMDSTFMGTLLGMAMLAEKNRKSPQVVIVNCSRDNFKLLEGLGVTQLIPVKTESVVFPQVQLTSLTSGENLRKKRMETIYQAHQNLVEVDEANVEKFGDFLKSLMREMK